MNSANSTKFLSRLIVAICAISSAPTGIAAQTQLTDAPLLESNNGVAVKPNILFTLDDSGSMAWAFVPDAANALRGKVGFANHLCNGIYYDPSTTYSVPRTYLNGDMPSSSFTAAFYDGFIPTTQDPNSGSYPKATTVNLGTSFRAYDSNSSGSGSFGGSDNDTAQAAYYYRFTGSGTPTATDCEVVVSGSPTGWEKVVISTTAEKANFANWFSYYRTRILMMKASAGRAFAGITDKYRVGFITIHPMSSGSVSSSKFLGVADFADTAASGKSQKQKWFELFYSQTAASGTPLREALARAGRYFAGKNDSINSGMIPSASADPVQYSCQANFSILTTDGYWNGANGVLLDGTTEPSNQDGTDVRPMWDGTSAGATMVRKTYSLARECDNEGGQCSRSSGQRKVCLRTETIDSNNITISDVTTVASGCGANSTSRLPTPNPNVTTSGGSIGSSDTLADVAEYYYKTDLRTPTSGTTCPNAAGNDLCDNNVFKSTDNNNAEDDNNTAQHMTTFTLGLGISGTLAFDPSYKTQTSGDFVALRNGTKTWPVPDNGSTQNDPTKSDDLWHAAVNGRGQAFSASNPNQVMLSLQQALARIGQNTGSASAAAAASLAPTSAEGTLYIGKYTSSVWAGDIEAQTLNLSTMTVADATLWSAQAQLDPMVGTRLQPATQDTQEVPAQACDNRQIYLFRSGATDNLTNFTWNTFRCDSNRLVTGSAVSDGLDSTEKAFFASSVLTDVSQYAFMTDGTNNTANQRANAAGANLVNFLRGQVVNEGFISGNATQFYRTREHVLGDIVGGRPIYVRAPLFNYADTGYADYKTAQTSRTAMVYAGANDGMLHAFNATTGAEAWAFIPTMVLPTLHLLADNNYAVNHKFFVDGAPEVGDALWDGTWKTILVGGLNKGGKGFYALDITDPASPKGLWEFKYGSTCFDAASTSPQFTDCHLGYSFGNPIITKLTDGTWVVLVTSGYNNVTSPTALAGDGKGYLYVLSAKDGHILYKIATTAGSATDPSGLAKISAWVDAPNIDNTTLRVYGGDLLGNLWRFDINDTITPSGRDAFNLAQLTDGATTPKAQPITTAPALTEVGSPAQPLIIVATGRYLGADDLSDTQTQSIYAIKDTFPATTLSSLRTTLRKVTLTNSGTTRTSACTTGGNCTSVFGWFADLPDSKERVFVDPRIEAGVLAVASGIPTNTACSPGGKGWLNLLNYSDGSQLADAPTASTEAMVVGLTAIDLSGIPGGKAGNIGIIGTLNEGKPFGEEAQGANVTTGRRVSWRELTVE